LRIVLASLLLLAILFLRGIKIPRDFNLWKRCFILGLFISGPPFVCFSYALTHISSSLSALINGMTPVLTVFLAHMILEDERLTPSRIVAVILGLAGFLILFVPVLLKGEFSFDMLGILLCFIGSTLYAIGAVYARKCLPKTAPLVAPTLQLLTSLLYLIPLAFIFETPMLDLQEASLAAYGSVFCVAVLGTMLAFILYHHIVTRHGATVLSMNTFLLPIFGTLLGVLFLNETLTTDFIIAAALILSGVGVINGLIPLPFVGNKKKLHRTS
jgi:drug/metabolite transporter (DMT)-like permease